MVQHIIYKQEGQILVVTPTPEALASHGIQAIAKKDVPDGIAYRIVDTFEIPTDRESRTQWELADSEFTDGVGAAGSTFEEIQNDL